MKGQVIECVLGARMVCFDVQQVGVSVRLIHCRPARFNQMLLRSWASQPGRVSMSRALSVAPDLVDGLGFVGLTSRRQVS